MNYKIRGTVCIVIVNYRIMYPTGDQDFGYLLAKKDTFYRIVPPLRLVVL